MARFLTALNVTLAEPAGLVSRAKWCLQTPLWYDSDILGRIQVPGGTVTDFASVPRLPVGFLLTGDSVYRPAVVHDWLYQTGDHPRFVADDVFLEAMTAVGVPDWRRQLMYRAVRLFGGAPYRRYTNERTEDSTPHSD